MGTRIAVILALCLTVMLSGEVTGADEHTRFGAEAGGNSSGEIPAFEGAQGLICPQDYRKGEYLPNPYREEKVLLRIDHTNVDKYQERLSPGQVARLKMNESFYMNVYPTHRNFGHPEKYYQAIEKNRETCTLDQEGVLRGFNGGIPFPYPKNGLEAIWNDNKPWAGDDLITDDCRRVVSPLGGIRKMRMTTKIMAFDETRLGSKVPNPDRVSMKVISTYTYPGDREGEASLAVSYIDDNKEQDIWVYIPALRRVRRAPTLQGGAQLDGEWTADEIGFGFRDTASDWHWRLVTKKEMYVPANNYEMWKLNARDEEECFAGDINPERLRYELHRVWVVEGIPAEEDLDHPYSKRVEYYDEDH